MRILINANVVLLTTLLLLPSYAFGAEAGDAIESESNQMVQEVTEEVSDSTEVETAFAGKLRRMKALADKGELSSNYKDKNETPEKLSYGTALQGLFLCLGVFFVSVYFLKKTNKAFASIDGRRMKIIERLAIGGKSGLLIVQVDNKELLLGTTDGDVKLIQQLDQSQTVTKVISVKESEPLRPEQVQCANE